MRNVVIVRKILVIKNRFYIYFITNTRYLFIDFGSIIRSIIFLHYNIIIYLENQIIYNINYKKNNISTHYIKRLSFVYVIFIFSNIILLNCIVIELLPITMSLKKKKKYFFILYETKHVSVAYSDNL